MFEKLFRKKPRKITAIAFIVLAVGCGACASNVAISGREEAKEALTNSFVSVRYDGCFWKNDLWEANWSNKKDRRRTLKMVRVKVYPWQSIAAVATLGWWVPVYLDWELNGDRK
jgi:hypothetical protein